jgi:hypothetical protein
MPLPTVRSSAFSQNLTNVAIPYGQKPEDGIGWSRNIAPIVGVDSDRGVYKVINKGDWFRSHMQRRATGSKAVRAGFRMSEAPFELEKFALRHDVFDDDSRNKPQIWKDRRAAAFLQQQAIISADSLAVTRLLTAGVGWATEMVGAASAVANTSVIGWNSGSSTPLVDLTTLIDLVRQRIGKRVNKMGLSPDVGMVLRRHADFTARVVGGATSASPGIVSYAAIEDILGLPRGAIFEMGTIVNTAAMGQTASMGYLCSETVWLGYVTDGPDIEEPSAAYTFVHSEIDGMSEDGVVSLKTYRDEPLACDAYEAELYHDIQPTALDAGVLLTSILSA